MVNVSSFISTPLLCQVTLTKKEKVLDPSPTVSSTRELGDNRQKMQAMFYFFLFPPRSHYGWNCIQETGDGINSKKLVMKRYPGPNQHLVYFNPKEKQTSTQKRANTAKGDHLQAKKVRHLNKFAGARELSKWFFSKHLSYKTFSPSDTINLQPTTCL